MANKHKRSNSEPQQPQDDWWLKRGPPPINGAAEESSNFGLPKNSGHHYDNYKPYEEARLLPSIQSESSRETTPKATTPTNFQSIIPTKTKSKRLASLDAVRGLTVVFMILVDNLGYWFENIDHSPWDHVTLADFVMPFFLFMVGCSMTLAFRKYKAGLITKIITRTFKLFMLGMLTQGSDFPSIGNTGFDLKRVRIPGILQRIAWAYFVVSLIALYVPKLKPIPDYPLNYVNKKDKGYFYGFRVHALQWAVTLLFMVIYLSLMLGMKVPTWKFHDPLTNKTITQTCDVRGDLTPACSATRYVDVQILGWDHMYDGGEFRRSKDCSSCSPAECGKDYKPKLGFIPKIWCSAPLDPEGILSSMPTIVTTYIGFHFGMVLQHYEDHKSRLLQWIPQSVFLLIVGMIVHFGAWPANKQLWSPAYVLMMGGTCGLFLSLFYVLQDATNWQPKWLRREHRVFGRTFVLLDVFFPLNWVGMNTIFIYLMSPSGGLWEAIQGYVYWDSPENTLQDSAYRAIFCSLHDSTSRLEICPQGMFSGHEQRWAQLAWILGRIFFWIGVAGVLHWRKWYWSL